MSAEEETPDRAETQPWDKLRPRAEAALAADSVEVTTDSNKVMRLDHELQVSRVELEMQNEELRRTQVELQFQVARYTELYDFAPVGYLTLDAQGRICECNLKFCDLIGLPRTTLLKQRLSHFIVSDDQEAYYFFRRKLVSDAEVRAELRLNPHKGEAFWGQFVAMPSPGPSKAAGTAEAQSWRVVIADITPRKQAETLKRTLTLELEARVDERTRLLNDLNEQLRAEVSRRVEIERRLREREERLLMTLRELKSEAIANARLYGELAEQSQHLQRLTDQLAEARETERQRLAVELHDQIAPNLTALSLNLQMVRSLATKRTRVGRSGAFEDLQKLIQATADRLRAITAGLRPPVLDDYGLLAALRWYGAQLSARTGLTVVVEGEDIAPRPPVNVEMGLFRIAQEALTNVLKHAKAMCATVTLHDDAGVLRLTITDDGCGFDPALLRQGNSTASWGIVYMRQHAKSLCGKLSLVSTPGAGTSVIVEVKR